MTNSFSGERIPGVGSYQVGKTWSLDLAPVRAAAAIGHEVHPKLSLSEKKVGCLR